MRVGPGAVTALLATVFTMSACGDKPVPEHGTIVGAHFTPAWVQIIPGTTMCSGNPLICRTMPPQIIPHPDQWSLTVRDLKNHDWEGTMTFNDPSVYNRCNLGELWPECSTEASGDTRPQGN